jgi:peroxiredoxin/predicted 2-oxoglutarate/Fe(II)-dependent dioxygenase YbiX
MARPGRGAKGAWRKPLEMRAPARHTGGMLTPAHPRRFEIGDAMPDVGLIGTDGKLVSLHHQSIAGQPLALFVYSDNDKPAPLRELGKFAAAIERFRAAGVRVVGLNRDTAQANAALALARQLPFPLLADPTGAVTLGLGLAGKGACLAAIVDANLRLSRRIETAGELPLAVPALQAGQALARPAKGGDPLVVRSQAPVLIVPNAFDGEFCKRLIAAWELGERFIGGVSNSNKAEATNVQYGQKRREDMVLNEPELLGRAVELVQRRVWSEIARCFNYRVSDSEAYRIGCYRAEDAGFFAAHRDNKTPLTKHRRFALSLLLNDDYEGGCLRFPEFGPALYKPPAGGAVVFSCELLHEVLPVTRGRRFVMVSFFFGPAEAAELRQREQSGAAGP